MDQINLEEQQLQDLCLQYVVVYFHSKNMINLDKIDRILT